MYSMNLFNSLNYNDSEVLKKIKKNRFEKFNSLPLPVWKRIKLDGFILPEYKEYNREYIRSTDENIKVSDIRNGLEDGSEIEKYFNVSEVFGVSEKFVSLGEALYNTGVFVKADRNIKADKLVRVSYSLGENNPLVIEHNIIVAKENSRVTIVIDYSSAEGNEAETIHNGVTKVFAERGSEVNVVKVQRLDKKAYHFDSNIAFIEGDAKVNWISVEIGGSLSSTSFINNLKGTASEADIKSVYLGDKESRLDLGYTMNHIGIRSKSNIETRGALKDKARKVFRGNLQFKKGARRSKGSEEEYVLLLDPTVKSDAIPVLFCGEDDVEGSHAASAGQIDAEKIFYLMSRGLDEREAKKLIVEASFSPILDKISDEKIRSEIEEEIHRRLVYA